MQKHQPEQHFPLATPQLAKECVALRIPLGTREEMVDAMKKAGCLQRCFLQHKNGWVKFFKRTGEHFHFKDGKVEAVMHLGAQLGKVRVLCEGRLEWVDVDDLVEER